MGARSSPKLDKACAVDVNQAMRQAQESSCALQILSAAKGEPIKVHSWFTAHWPDPLENLIKACD